MRRFLSFIGIGVVAAVIIIGGWPTSLPAQFTEEELERNPKLTPAMRKLILAYENYLTRFPNGARAKDFLIDEAGRFRDVGDNQSAVIAFKRVLGRGEITQGDRAYVYEQIMASYQVLTEYELQEEWAHRMAVADVGREKQQQAKDFIFSAGYNRAKALEDSGSIEPAGEAYERLSVKNPDHDQASAAMLKAASLYEQANDKGRAARTYERFYYTYPDYRDPQSGKGALLALETAAVLYYEMEDYRHTADATERILAAAPEHENRRQYMNNLAAIYALLKDYNNAIRVRQQFIALYPRDPRAGSYQWDIAEYRGLAGQRQQQLAEYEAFVRDYPGDYRAIQANYLIGESQLRDRKKAFDRRATDEAERLLQVARAHFERAYSLHDSVEKEKQGAGDVAHALAAIEEVAKMDSANYYAINLARTEHFSQDSTRKWQALQKAAEIYFKIANYTYPPSTFQALYKRGRLFEDFAEEYLKQPRPDTAITYDQILNVFFINAVSQTFLSKLAIPAYERQMISFYQENQATIDTAAFTIPDASLRRVHLYYLEEARKRLGAIPQKLDSLTLNTIRYEADVIVLDAQEQIPKKFEEAWGTFRQQRAARYREDPKLQYPDRQNIFDIGVSPVVYGKSQSDTTALVKRFQQIIAEGQRLGADTSWVLYNRGRLRLVYGARSNYFREVADESVDGVGVQVDTLRRRSEFLTQIVARLPKIDLSVLGPAPERPDLTPPEAPVRPEGDLQALAANPETRPLVIRFLEEFKNYRAQVQGIQRRVDRYKRRIDEYQRRRDQVIQDYSNRFRDIVADAGREAQVFSEYARNTQIYRLTIEQVMDRTYDAFERDISFGDSIGYSDRDRRAVRDLALTAAMRVGREMDSLYANVLNIRDYYETARDTASGGEGSPAFRVLNNLVTGYAAVADSFRSATIRRYLYVYEGRDSTFNVGIEHPTVVAAIARLKQLDPTFGVTTVPLAFTYVTEDSTGLWRVSSRFDKDNPDAWKGLAFNDSSWAMAVQGTMRKYETIRPEPSPTGMVTPAPNEVAGAPATDTTARLGAEPGSDTTASVQPTDTLAAARTDSLAAAPAETAAVAPMGPQPAEGPPREGERRFLITGFPEKNLNMTDLWSPEYADTVYFRYRLELPPRWSELPDSLKEPGLPRPVVRKASITITADDNYAVYVNGQVTNAADQSGRTDWQEARTYDILPDQWFVGDTLNIMAIRASNEKRVERVPDTDTTTYGLLARIDVEVDVPYAMYEILYKRPEPEPEFVLAFTPDDSVRLNDTTGTVFLTALERQQWRECREREIHASWKDSVLTPWRLVRAQNKVADLDTQIVRTKRLIAEKQQEARARLAQAAGAAVGIEEEAPGELPGAQEIQGGEESGQPQDPPHDSGSNNEGVPPGGTGTTKPPGSAGGG